jgi:hypothetical protein
MRKKKTTNPHPQRGDECMKRELSANILSQIVWTLIGASIFFGLWQGSGWAGLFMFNLLMMLALIQTN